MKKNKSKLFILIGIVVLLLSSVAMFTACDSDEETVTYDYFTFTYDADLKGLVLTDVTVASLSAEVTIPDYCTETGSDSTDEYVIVGIGDGAFKNAVSMTSISLPETVVSIGDEAFYGCAKLSTIDLENVATIGDSAFAYCKSLVSVTLSDDLTVIADNAFYNASGLKEVIGGSITSIGDKSFGSCLLLLTFDIDMSALESIGDKAFFFVGLNDIVIEKSVTYVGSSAFEGWSTYQSVSYYDDSTFASDWQGGVSDTSIFIKL